MNEVCVLVASVFDVVIAVGCQGNEHMLHLIKRKQSSAATGGGSGALARE